MDAISNNIIQFARGTNTAVNVRTGYDGEPAYNKDTNEIVVYDGLTRGGSTINTLTTKDLGSNVDLNKLTVYGRYFIHGAKNTPPGVGSTDDIIVEVISPKYNSFIVFQYVTVVSGNKTSSKFFRSSTSKNTTFNVDWTDCTPGTWNGCKKIISRNPPTKDIGNVGDIYFQVVQ